MNEPDLIREILTSCKSIAVVGLSNNGNRASYGVSRFMQSRGYRIVPVNPMIGGALDEVAFPTLDAALAAAPGIRLVNVFRAPEHVSAIVDDVIRLRIPYLWLQEGVIDSAAAKRAETAGVKVVMDRCILKDRMNLGWD
ncbi:MAG TPA: CoA-binding protein [Acidobacteriaceae bacterium]|nr:CoA-binding protein [Acidobacteriaceae bacterium]